MDERVLEDLVARIVAEVRRQLDAAADRQAEPRVRLLLVLGDGHLPATCWSELQALEEEPVAVTSLLCDSLAQPEEARARLGFGRLLTCREVEDPAALMEEHELVYLPRMSRSRLAELAHLTTTCRGNDVVLEALAAGRPVYAVDEAFMTVVRRWRARGTPGGQRMAAQVEALARECGSWGLHWLGAGAGLAALRARWHPSVPAASPSPAPRGAGRPLITAADIEAVQGDELVLARGAIVTPLARDLARQRGVRLTEQ